MELTLLLLAVVLIINIVASARVLRVPDLSRSQRHFQLALIWIVPIIGSVVCLAFASSQTFGPFSPSTHDPLYLPADGGGPEGPGIGICGCSGSDGGGDGGGD